ncbi:MAG TPA: MqnA/MqnD/SBP family protein, partial [Anaeromyxobacteraceae bacterium]|nr:MqnA/MqnD/SBP family protein [Anaeromyxobacteraceae bacterium]
GVNAIRKDLPAKLRETLARVMRESIDYSLDHREQALDHAMGYARGLDRSRADTFVGMYVNDWTRELGPRGRRAVELFLSESADRGLVPRVKVEFQER